MTVLTSSSHRAGQGVSQDHFGSLIHHMVLEITLGSHFRLRSHFSENSVNFAKFISVLSLATTEPHIGTVTSHGSNMVLHLSIEVFYLAIHVHVHTTKL